MNIKYTQDDIDEVRAHWDDCLRELMQVRDQLAEEKAARERAEGDAKHHQDFGVHVERINDELRQRIEQLETARAEAEEDLRFEEREAEHWEKQAARRMTRIEQLETQLAKAREALQHERYEIRATPIDQLVRLTITQSASGMWVPWPEVKKALAQPAQEKNDGDA